MKQLILLTFTMLLLSACGNKKGEYDASGIFETTEVIVSSQANGQLLVFNVEEGQILEADKQLGYVDTTQLYLKKMQLLASMRAVGSRQTNIPNQIAALKQQILTQKTELKRFENLIKFNAANQKQVDDIRAMIAYLERQLVAQTESMTKGNLSISGESSALEIQVAQMEDQLKKSIISSPIKGSVLSKYAEQGEMTIAGKALFKVADINKMYLRAYITSDQISQLKIGQQVKVYADFGEKDKKEYQGTVSWISDNAEFTPKTIQTRNERANQVYAVKITVKNDGYLKNGMYGELSIH